jgi:hypothetical protein
VPQNVRLIIETMDPPGSRREDQPVLNRSNAFTGINVKNAEGALKRTIEHQVVNEYRGAISPQLGRAVHVHEGGLGAGCLAAPVRAGGRQAGRCGRGDRAEPLTVLARISAG